MENVSYHSTVCSRFNGRPHGYPISPDLPKLQVNIDQASIGVGIDYLDTLICKNIYVNDLEDHGMHKCYHTLYTCVTKRGVV